MIEYGSLLPLTASLLFRERLVFQIALDNDTDQLGYSSLSRLLRNLITAAGLRLLALINITPLLPL
ncbi:MAG: hypothetical protein K0R08_7 [Solimicrobium sp.]|jgi:hypothetical protein|nr:hypothetical protein [Solimicrobium sp.]